MTITINGSTGITDADGGTVLNSNDLASQAQAEAGTNNTTLMTPLRTAQAITNLGYQNYFGSSLNLSGLSAVEFTNIPSGVSSVIVNIINGSLTGSDEIVVILGTASGYTTNSSTSLSALSGTTSVVNTSAGNLIWVDSASYNVIGNMTFTRFEGSGNSWVQTNSFRNSSTNTSMGSGYVSLPSVLTKIKVQCTGTSSFDAGTANISWEV